MRPWAQSAPWESVAAELAGHLEAGLQRLLTEDVLRFAAARQLVAGGCDPALLRLEWPHPQLSGARVDLVYGTPVLAAIEFKYPREPTEKTLPYTMVLGHILKDVYRLSLLPDGDRVFALLQTDRLRRYLVGAAGRYGIDLDRDAIVLDPDAAALLPATASAVVGPDLLRRRVTAARLCHLPVGPSAQLSVYLVDGPTEAATEAAPSALHHEPAAEVGAAPPTRAARVPRSASGARGEIHRAVNNVLRRSGRAAFGLDEVVREMRDLGSRYAESTVRTMVTSHLCASSPDHAAVTHDDFERVGRGLYRWAASTTKGGSQNSSAGPSAETGF